MKKTEKRMFLSTRIFEWAENYKTTIRLIFATLYIVFVIAFAVLVVSLSGGVQDFVQILNYYPEQKYQQLEQELQNIIVENDGIYPEKLSNDSINYKISYNEHSNFEGEYTIELTDGETVTGRIGKDFKKENLIIERKYKTESEYRTTQYISTIAGIIIIPLMLILFLVLIIHLLLVFLYIIEAPVMLYHKIKAKN